MAGIKYCTGISKVIDRFTVNNILQLGVRLWAGVTRFSEESR